ncbi:SDR family NAD(P)-dependent oxidoreductase [Myroides sp. M-43]|uniref:SDR family NAD(P)-dependent oxidoreductase n=1 Tax=Myroides oncorhynchi TaxID=2893756 RepID=UPI001E64002F|nr:SDR family NAD(P)-dependent oxidoreductase [Myroides oncorhynchi]MCC9043492.1 SDR family NAD(P)-dependent oxidoreductase [Myroides oncorhynchi]
MIVITSASRGIGKFLFDKFKQEGKSVIGFYNTTVPSCLDDYYKIDITNEEEVKLFVTNNKHSFSDLVLINTAGISYNAFAHKTDFLEWKKVLDVNLLSLFNLTQQLLPFMREGNYGRIVNFSSVVAQKGVAGTSAYAASKSAMWGLAKSICIENASKNITMNNVNLGYFNIGMIEQVPELYLQQLITTIPAKRLGEAEEILKTINFIIDTPYLNGTSIDLNGGLY